MLDSQLLPRNTRSIKSILSRLSAITLFVTSYAYADAAFDQTLASCQIFSQLFDNTCDPL